MEIGKPQRILEVKPKPAKREIAAPEREAAPAEPIPVKEPAPSKVPVPV